MTSYCHQKRNKKLKFRTGAKKKAKGFCLLLLASDPLRIFSEEKKGARSLHVFLFRQSLSSSKIFQPQNNCYFPRNLCQTRSDHQKTSSIFIEFTTIYAHFFSNSYYVRYVRNCAVSIFENIFQHTLFYDTNGQIS